MDVNRQHVVTTAEQDAQSDVSKLLWLAVGFALSIVGILLAYIYQQSPPATRIYEKSQEYIVFYTEAYKAQTRRIQVKYAVIGLLFTAVLVLIYIFVTISIYSRIWREFPRGL